MGNIREYGQRTTAQGGIPGRAARPTDFGGTGLRDLGETLGKVVQRTEDHEERLEVSRANALITKAEADWITNLRERGLKAEPGDPTFSTTFNEDLKKYIDKSREGFETIGGQEAFEAGAAALSASFVVKSGQFQAKLAGAKAVQEFEATVDSLQQIVDGDPTRFEEKRLQLEAIINDPAGMFFNIDPLKRPAIIKDATIQLAKSAMGSIVATAPNFAKKMLNNPESNVAQYLTGEQLRSMKEKAEVGIGNKETAAARVKAAERKARQDKWKANETKLISRLLDPEAEDGMPEDTEISIMGKHDELDGDAMRTVTRFRDSRVIEMTRPVLKEPSKFLNVLDDIRSGEITDEGQIYMAYSNSVELGRGIDWQDVGVLKKEFAELRTPEGASLVKRKDKFMKGIRPKIDKSNLLMGKIDQDGPSQVREFEIFVEQKIDEFRKNPNKNPHDLFIPGNPNYLDNPGVLSGFQKTMEESLRSMTKQLLDRPSPLNAPEARKSGESLNDYDRRTSK